jgi:hypothetical protein
MPAAAWRGFMLRDSIRWGAPGRSLSCAEHYVMAMCKEARSQTLLRAYGEIHAREMRYRHMIGNFLYDVTGNEATGQATFLATLATRSGFKFFGQGKYRDKLVKQNGHWLIAHRCVDVDRLASEPNKIVGLLDPDVASLVQPLVDACARLGEKV